MIITEGKGLKPPHGEFLFPLSKDIVLRGSWHNLKNVKDFFISVDNNIDQQSAIFKPNTLDFINKTIVQQATKYIFYNDEINNILELIEQE